MSCYPLSKANCHNCVSENGEKKNQQNKFDPFDFEEVNTDEFHIRKIWLKNEEKMGSK